MALVSPNTWTGPRSDDATALPRGVLDRLDARRSALAEVDVPVEIEAEAEPPPDLLELVGSEALVEPFLDPGPGGVAGADLIEVVDVSEGVDGIVNLVDMAPLSPSALAAVSPAIPSLDSPLPAEHVGPLTVEEEQQLARRWRDRSEQNALRRLVQAHLGLVIRIAREFRHSGPAMEDLIQEGNLGLTIAAQRFDPDRATRLSTFATYWIRACMMEHVVRSHGPVRIGTTRAQRKIFFGLSRARRKLESSGAPADAEALAGVLGVEPQDVESMVPRLSGRDVALDAPRGSDDERPSSALLADQSPTPEEMVACVEEDGARKALLLDALKVLDKRERTIIRARHMSQRPATLAALGKKFNISRERVRQLELRAVNKLRQRCGVCVAANSGSAERAEADEPMSAEAGR